MRARSQRHLASARGSSLLAWLPQPGRGARSPPAHHRLPAPVSRLGSLGRRLLLRPGVLGGCRVCPALPGTPKLERVPLWGEEGTGQQRLRVGQHPCLGCWRLALSLRFSPTANVSPRAPCLASASWCLLLSRLRVLAEPAAVLAGHGGPAVPLVPKLGTGSRCGGTWHEPSPSRRWGPAGGFPCRVAVAGRCRASWHAAGGGPQPSAAGGPVLGAAPTGPRPQPCCRWAVLLASPRGSWWPWGHAGCSSRAALLW